MIWVNSWPGFLNDDVMIESFKKLNWWQLALLSIAVSAIGGLASGRRKKKERKVYDVELKQAPWAPPGWIFGPAWAINNFFILSALQKILNSDDPQKRRLLAMQAAIWAIFFSFGYIYFNKKSPILAAVWTVSDALLAGVSVLTAGRLDKKIALKYVPLLLWTGFAGSLAIYQTLHNRDPLFQKQIVI
jgi:tryptophan-rich sensory protein